MKRMKHIDWIDTNTSQRTYTQMLRLTNWTGIIDRLSASRFRGCFYFFSSKWTEWRPLLIAGIKLLSDIDLQRTTMQRRR